MALDKAIKSGKEHRKPYYDSRDFDMSCRNNKDCPACYSNRNYANIKRIERAKEQVKDG